MGAAVAAVADLFGQPLMPWQRLVADVGLELLDDGRPAYRRVCFTVPRQSGKTTLVLSWEVQRATGWSQILGVPQRIAYSAQTGKDAREKLLQDQWPMLAPQKRVLGIDRAIRTNGSEAVIWKNGSILGLLASGEESGHGKTIDLGVKDELFADVDMRRDQALNPAMATRPHAQELTASTMGTSESVALNAEVEAGRLSVREGLDSGVAYFEWSAHPDDDPGDPATWWRCMPALGRTITVDVVEHAYRTLPIDEFRRAYLNIPTASDTQVIPPGAWVNVCDPDLEVSAQVFAFDVNPDRSAVGIVAAGSRQVEVVDFRPGVGWLVDRLVELHARHKVPVVVDRRGPGAAFVDALEARGVPLVQLDTADIVRAAGAFFDAVMEGKVRVRSNSDFDVAVAGAAKRPVGDAWAWGRKSSAGDVSLLVAASNGLWASETTSTPFVMDLSAL